VGFITGNSLTEWAPIPPPPLIYLLKQLTDLHEICYGHYAIGVYCYRINIIFVQLVIIMWLAHEPVRWEAQ
jgi:hypothetical protein